MDVRLPARHDGVSIAAWYIPHPGSAAAVVLVHGKDQSRDSECKGRFLELAATLHHSGLSVLMIDLRGHGSSGRARLTFGVRERRDVLGAYDWLRRQGYPAGSIGVLGISLGGVAALTAASEESGLAAVVADSAFAEVASLIRANWHEAVGLPTWLEPPIRLATSLLCRCDLAAVRPIDELHELAERPVLLIHGTEDTRVPIDHAYALRAGLASAELWVLPNVGHAGGYAADPQGYASRVTAFLTRQLTLQWNQAAAGRSA